MSLQKETGFQNLLAQACSALAASFGLITLLGWILKLPLLSSFGLHLIPMAPSTALLFILLGGLFFFRARGAKNRTWNRTELLIGCLVAFISLALLILSSQGIYSDLEHLGLQIDGKLNSTPVGHMSPVTAFSFLLVSLTFLTSLSASSASPRRVLAVWGLAGFILLTNYVFVLAYFLGLPLLYGINTIPPALPTSLAFLALGIALLASASAQGKTQQTGVSRPVPYTILLVFTTLALSIVTGGYLYYQNYEQQFRTQIERQLSAIADLKVSELVSWRNERLGDANVLYRNPAFAEQVAYYLENPADLQAQKQVQAWLDKFQTNYQYKHVSLLDTHGLERISAPAASAPTNVYLVKHAAAALSSGQVTFVDFHRDTPNDPIHLAMLVPIFSEQEDGHPLGVLFFQIDPEVYLYPFLQQWPIPSLSAETLLIRREDDAALFLNHLRFQPDAALNLRIPLTETDRLSVKATLGQTGIAEGRDYREKAVLGALAPVPDTPWFLVARMDMAEVYAPLRERLWETSLFFGGLLVACGAGLLLFWRQQRMRYYQAQIEMLNALHESQAQVANVFNSAMDAIITVDEDQKIIIFNPSAEQMFGCLANEVVGQTMDRFLPEYAHKLHRKHMHIFGQSDSTKRSMKTPMLALTCLRANGEAFASDISISHIEIGGRKLYTAIIRDITERKQAEDALRESEARYRHTLEAMLEGCQIIDFDWRYIYLNDAADQHNRRSKDELLGKKYMDMWPDIESTNVFAVIRRCLEERIPQSMENEFAFPDGSKGWFDLKIYPVPEGIAILSLDITERKKTEKQLRETKELYQALFDQSADAVFILDLDGRHVEANQRAAAMLGYEYEEILGLSMRDISAEMDNSENVLERLLQGEVIPPYERSFRKKNGELINVEPHITLICNQGGHPFRIQSIVRDITERKQTQDELRQSQENFARAFISSPTALAITRRADGKFLSLNEAYTRVMGYEPAEILARTPAEMKIYVNQGEQDDLVQQLGEKGSARDYEFLVNTKSGQIRNFLVSMEPILYNKEASIISTFIDITERKLAEHKLAEYSTQLEEMVVERTRELRDAQEQLVRQERLAALGQLAGSLGHELRNPLGVISNAIYFLKMSQPEANNKVREYLDIIEKETHTSNKIITDLLDFTRIKSLDRQPVSVSELIDQTLERNPAPAPVEVQVEIPADLPPIFADPQHVIQILGNLISNAHQAMLAEKPASTEKKLKVSVAEQHDMIKITVTDTGPGIPPENLAKLFQPLFTTKTKGIGLGLAVSQKLVEANGGKIKVESAVGKGSAFTVYLPVCKK